MKASGGHDTFMFNLYMYDRDHHILSPFVPRPCRCPGLHERRDFSKINGFFPFFPAIYVDTLTFEPSSVEHRPLRTLLASEVHQPSCVRFSHEVLCTHSRAFDLGG